MPVLSSFPLLMASVSSNKMFVSSPLRFLNNQCSDILLSLAELEEPPRLDTSFGKVRRFRKLFNLVVL